MMKGGYGPLFGVSRVVYARVVIEIIVVYATFSTGTLVEYAMAQLILKEPETAQAEPQEL